MTQFYFILLIFIKISAIKSNSVKEVFRRDGDVNIAVILTNKCNNTSSLTEIEQTLVNSAIWTTHQLNYSDILPQITLGLAVFKTCNQQEEYETIFELFRQNEVLLGLVTSSKFSVKIQKFCDVLDLSVKQTVKCYSPLVKASISVLKALNWVDNITVISTNGKILDEFLKISKNEWICINHYFLQDSLKISKNFSSSEYFVIFGNQEFLTSILKNYDIFNAIIVPLDNSVLKELPENSYLITNKQNLQKFEILESNFYTPNPQLFEIAIPIVTYAQNLKEFTEDNCNGSTTKSCLKKFVQTTQNYINLNQIVDWLKIETSSINYHVYTTENNSQIFKKIFIYNIFSNNLTQLSSTSLDFENSSTISCIQNSKLCKTKCKNFELRSSFLNLFSDSEIRIRPESWVFAFLSLSLLGILLTTAILIFLLISICRRNILEGNPTLTILLLLIVMLMYCSILPLSLEGGKLVKESICLARSLSITLTFSAAFSLILSRSILLATASKEIGFMSHVAGPVQSFLCLFIFGVQAALSLQIINRCNEIFKGYSFLYLLSYNGMLLLLLLCLSPLIFKCQRNYKEGKYFTFAVITICCLWCFWVPAYIFLREEYKDIVLSFGVVSTASAILGVIFIPRTYLMTIAAARDKMTSTLPSLTATTSAMDIYRAGTQPVYDCVNVAAINAVTVARAGLTQLQQPDLYTCPTLPEDEDFDLRCDSPIHDDKVTRF